MTELERDVWEYIKATRLGMIIRANDISSKWWNDRRIDAVEWYRAYRAVKEKERAALARLESEITGGTP